MKEKKCNNCGKIKPLDEFHKGNGKGGRRTWCAKCCNAKWCNPERNKKRNEARKKRREDPEYREYEYEMEKLRKSKDPRKYLIYSAKSRAKKVNMDFNLSFDDLELPDICPILEIPLQYNRGGLQDNSYSLDRKDSSKGYIKGNVWIISHKANAMKNNATKEELELFSKNINKLWIN